MKRPFVSQIFASLAGEVGITVNLEPQYGFAGQIILPDGRKRYFRDTHMDINPLGAAEIAGDKDYAAYFISLLGYPVVRSWNFYSKRWCEVIRSKRNIDAAYRHVQRLGFPVFVKPNSSSQGRGVAKVHTKREFYRAARFIFSKDRVMLVQKTAEGQDYRIVVLDDEVISAYQRIPLSVIGDDRATIRQLLRRKQREFRQRGRDTQLKLDDFRIKMKLARMKLTFDSVLFRDQQIFLLDNANLSTGGEAVDATERISNGFRDLAVRLTRELNLRYCGVDLITTDPIETEPRHFQILEVNSAPGLDHYANIGQAQKQLVRDLYRKVLEAFKRG
jgi:D-alanine-D-alanine ligase-like ATP-grasp enzyme